MKPAIDTVWYKSINSFLESSSEVKHIKQLRKIVLLSLQFDESDKSAKKRFKKCIQSMEREGTLQLDTDGTVNCLNKSKKRKETSSSHEEMEHKRAKKEKKKKKKKKKTNDDTSLIDNDIDNVTDEKKANDSGISTEDTCAATSGNDEDNDSAHADLVSNYEDDSVLEKNKPCKGNLQGITRLFLGNLPFTVDESALGAFLHGKNTHIKWITDKETGKFYGSAFIEMDNSVSAADAVAMTGSKLIGRPIKINFAPSRDGDVWPPAKTVVSGGGTTGGGGQAGGTGTKAMSAKPENCLKLFVGNLSYEIDDERIIKFFGNVEAEVKAVRWLHHKESGDFKGCGFVEFYKADACEKGATLNGKNLMGRPIRIDWTD